MKHLRFVVLLSAVLVASVAGTVVVVGVGPFERGPGTQTYVVNGENGPERITVPDFPDPATLPSPTAYGDFLVLPAGSQSHTGVAYAAAITQPIVGDRRQDVIKSDPLYPRSKLTADPSAQEDLTARRSGDQILEIRASYAIEAGGQARGVEVVRWRPRLPFEVDAPVAGPGRTLEYGHVLDAPAIFYKSGPKEDAYNGIWFMRDGLLTQMSGAIPFDALMKIAETIQ